MSAATNFAWFRRPIWFFAAAALGCDPGPPQPPFPGDGTAGFGDAARVEVCLGGARIAASSSASACVPDDRAAEACEDDAACSSTEACFCGRCVVLPCGAGSVCPAGEACRGGRCTVACVSDDACAKGERCDGGGCAATCDDDKDCPFGETCGLAGTCSVKACGPGGSCGSGERCEVVEIEGEMREPHAITTEAGGVALFELSRPSEPKAIFRARIEAPLAWVIDPETPVIEGPDGVGAPSIAIVDGDWHVFVAIGDGAAIGRAISTDGGATFTLDSKPILVPEAPWEADRVGSPGAAVWNDEVVLFYEGGDGAGIGLARVKGAAATRASSAPILTPAMLVDAASWRKVETIGRPFCTLGAPVAFGASAPNPSAQAGGGSLRVYVTARGIEIGSGATANGPIPIASNDSIGLFATTDLITFDRYPAGPVLAAAAGLTGSLNESDPALSLDEFGASLLFVRSENNTPVGLFRAPPNWQ